MTYKIENVLVIQTYLLDIPFRLWTPFPTGRNSRLKHILTRAALLFYWIWCFIMLIFMGIKAGESILSSQNNSKVSPIVRVLAGIPNFFLTLRGNLTLVVLALRRDSLAELTQQLQFLTYRFITSNQTCLKTRKWVCLNGALTTYCLIVFAVIQCLSWLHGMESERHKLSSEYSLAPFAVTMPVWTFILLQVVCMYVPYFLSQVLLVGAVVMGAMIGDCSDMINEKLRDLEGRIKRQLKGPKVTGKEWVGSDEMEGLAGEVERLIADRAAVYQFDQRWNLYFGWLLFVAYTADVCASAGMLAVFVANSEPSSYQFAAKLVGCLGFVSFATALYIPLVLAAEVSHKTSSYVYIATNTAYPLFRKDYHIRLREVLNDLCSMSITFPIDFSASGFFHVERRFIATTITLLSSFGIVLVEFLGNEESSKDHGTTIDVGSILNMSSVLNETKLFISRTTSD